MILTEQQTRMYALFQNKGVDKDINIDDIFSTMGLKKPESKSGREKQQHVGSALSRLNVKLRGEGFEVVPGALKRTYRLVVYDKTMQAISDGLFT